MGERSGMIEKVPILADPPTSPMLDVTVKLLGTWVYIGRCQGDFRAEIPIWVDT